MEAQVAISLVPVVVAAKTQENEYVSNKTKVNIEINFFIFCLKLKL